MTEWLDSLMNGTADETTEIPKDLGAVSELCNRLVEAQQEVAEAETALKERKERLKRIQENLLPEALQELGLEELKLANGKKIKLKEFLNCHILNQDFGIALGWLNENEHGDIVKNEVTLQFGKDSAEAKEAFDEYLRGWNRLAEAEVVSKTTIHPQTLNKFAKTVLAEGGELPDVFRVHQGVKAEIK